MQAQTKEDVHKGILYALIGFFFMALFGIFLKAARQGASPLWTNFVAYATASSFLFILLCKEGFSVMKTKHFGLHFLRAIFGLSAVLAYIYSVRYIPLLNATLLFNATPLFVPIFALLILKKGSPWITWCAILLGFIGIALIIHPNIALLDHPADFIGLFSGVSLALAFTLIKKLTETEVHKCIVFYFFFIATALQLPFTPFFGEFPTSQNLLFSAGAGVMFLIAKWNIVKSYQYTHPAQATLFQYAAVAFVGLFDWLIWAVTPSRIELLGIAIVVLAALMIAFFSQSKRRGIS